MLTGLLVTAVPRQVIRQAIQDHTSVWTTLIKCWYQQEKKRQIQCGWPWREKSFFVCLFLKNCLETVMKTVQRSSEVTFWQPLPMTEWQWGVWDFKIVWDDQEQKAFSDALPKHRVYHYINQEPHQECHHPHTSNVLQVFTQIAIFCSKNVFQKLCFVIGSSKCLLHNIPLLTKIALIKARSVGNKSFILNDFFCHTWSGYIMHYWNLAHKWGLKPTFWTSMAYSM